MHIKKVVYRFFWAFSVVATLALFACRADRLPLSPVESRSIVLADGVTLEYGLVGSGRPLLLLTGYAMTREMWDSGFIRELALSRRVILMDNRGMGQTPLGDAAEVSITRMARDAVAVLEALDRGRADVLGWSMGGMIAQELALERPDMVCSLVLLASASDIAPLVPELERLNAMNSEEIRQAMFPPGWSAAHPEAYDRVMPRPRPPDMRVVAAQYTAMRQWTGTSGRLGDIRAPVLLLVGAEDRVCPPGASQAMYERLSGRADAPLALEVVAQGSHWMMHQFPEELARMVNAFLLAQHCAPAR